MKQVRQAVTEESLFLELRQWCKEGAARTRDRLQLMSAFASGPAIEVLEPFFDTFLADGNFIDIIIGIDRKGTSKEAISRLYELQFSYAKQITCRVFHAPSNTGIFHPKLYLHHTRDSISGIVGSANLTLGGLGNNFESIFLYRQIPRQSNDAKWLVDTWDTFAHPTYPLKKSFVRNLTESYAKKLIDELPGSSQIDGPNTRQRMKAIWEPVSKIRLPRSRAPIQRPVSVLKKRINKFLVIDVLTETRVTQMQLPLDIVERFFGIKRFEPGSIQLRYVRAGDMTQPIDRKIVKSGGMRRIEMPQIWGKARPLAAIFFRFKSGYFAVEVIPQHTKAYSVVNRLLDNHGQQPEHADRRYYMGKSRDPLFQSLRSILGSTALKLARSRR